MGVTDYLATDTSVKALEYSFSAQMTAQIYGVLTAVILSAVVSYVALMICKYHRQACSVPEQEEREASTSAPMASVPTPSSAIQNTTEKRPARGAFSCGV